MKSQITELIANFIFVLIGSATRLLVSYNKHRTLTTVKILREVGMGVGLFLVAMAISNYAKLDTLWSCGVSYILGYAGKSMLDLVVKALYKKIEEK